MPHLHYSGYIWDGTGLRPASPYTTEVPPRAPHTLPGMGADAPSKNLTKLLFIGGILALILWTLTEKKPRRNPDDDWETWDGKSWPPPQAKESRKPKGAIRWVPPKKGVRDYGYWVMPRTKKYYWNRYYDKPKWLMVVRKTKGGKIHSTRVIDTKGKARKLWKDYRARHPGRYVTIEPHPKAQRPPDME